jgi:hypothetical protein
MLLKLAGREETLRGGARRSGRGLGAQSRHQPWYERTQPRAPNGEGRFAPVNRVTVQLAID